MNGCNDGSIPGYLFEHIHRQSLIRSHTTHHNHHRNHVVFPVFTLPVALSSFSISSPYPLLSSLAIPVYVFYEYTVYVTCYIYDILTPLHYVYDVDEAGKREKSSGAFLLHIKRR